MALKDQLITDQFALYNGDCIEVMRDMPDASVDLVLYSPPFGGLYVYSSDDRDLSNSIDKEEFFEHYHFCIAETARLLKPGRIAAVHCMDIPLSNAGCDEMFDLAGRIIQEHLACGFAYGGRRLIWKEPLMVRNRTMMKSLHHSTLIEDSTRCSIANADWLLMFRRKGENKVPVTHEEGLMSYAGERSVPGDLLKWRGHRGDQKKNQYSQWIWRQYASSMWDDIRIDRVLSYKNARQPEDEKHCHPLQLDVVERACVLWSNSGETVLTPFMGIGSEVAGAVMNDRRGIGIELKESYYAQAVRNLTAVLEQSGDVGEQRDLFSEMEISA